MNILIADDHAVVRKGLIQILRETLFTPDVTEAANAGELLEKLPEKKWDVIILDISMPGGNGIDLLKQIKAKGTRTPVLILSMHSEEQYGMRALRAGAAGFMNKESAAAELAIAINRLLAGRKYVPAGLAEILARDHATEQADPLESLSDRELQVFQLLAQGMTVSEIGIEMSLSVNTISTYRSRILEKLNLKNNSQLIRYALDMGI